MHIQQFKVYCLPSSRFPFLCIIYHVRKLCVFGGYRQFTGMGHLELDACVAVDCLRGGGWVEHACLLNPPPWADVCTNGSILDTVEGTLLKVFYTVSKECSKKRSVSHLCKVRVTYSIFCNLECITESHEICTSHQVILTHKSPLWEEEKRNTGNMSTHNTMRVQKANKSQWHIQKALLNPMGLRGTGWNELCITYWCCFYFNACISQTLFVM